MENTYPVNWKVGMIQPEFGSAVIGRIEEITKEHFPFFQEMLPFRQSFECDAVNNKDFVAIHLKEKGGTNAIPSGGILTDKAVIDAAAEIFSKNRFPSFENLTKKLPSHAYQFGAFTYVGPYEKSNLSWVHINEIIANWFSCFVLPRIENRNKERVLRAVPKPPSYDLQNIIKNIYVLESESTYSQGTCFHLKDVGLVTCQHAIRPDLVAFHPTNTTKKYKVTTKCQNSALDLAIVEASGLNLSDGMQIGTAEQLLQMDHVAVAGFPNYRYGDSGIVSPGLVVGFRTVSAIRRILLNVPIVAGNSGGPVLNALGNVVGVAVTGADRMEEAHETENHGVVPIDALSLIQ